MKKQESQSLFKNEKGFTLIEVIAVLIILGILAAVAVPKYFDISEQAKEKAFDSALSQGMSLCSLAYGKAALDLSGEPEAQDVIDALNGIDLKTRDESTSSGADNDTTIPSIEGDFVFTFELNSGGGDGTNGDQPPSDKDFIKITATGAEKSPFPGEERIAYWILP